MKATTWIPSAAAACLLLTASLAQAKLPVPELDAQAQAKAAEAAAKAAWSGKVGVWQLCRAQDRVAARFGKNPATASDCTDPGPFAYTPPAEKPSEAAGAHSPAGTASSPPSTAAPAAAVPAPKS